MAGDQIQVNVRWRDMPLMTGVVLESIDPQVAFVQTDYPMPVWTELEISMTLDEGLRVPAKVEQVMEACRTQPNHSDMIAGMKLRLEAEALALLFGWDQEPHAPASVGADDFESLQPAPIVGDASSDSEVVEDSSPDLVASVSTSRISRSVLEKEREKEREVQEIQSVATGEFEIPSSAQTQRQSMRESNFTSDKVIIDISEDESQMMQGDQDLAGSADADQTTPVITGHPMEIAQESAEETPAEMAGKDSATGPDANAANGPDANAANGPDANSAKKQKKKKGRKKKK